VPDFIDDWFGGLAPVSLAEAVGEPGAAAVFSTDMINGFCREGALASERVRALAGPVSDLFRRAYDLGVRRFVLTQDTHDPAAPEFEAWPPHCVRGTVEAETIAELGELPFASELVVFEKNSLHPALGTGFDAWLDDQPGLRTAVVVGNCTDLCVYQLAMHLRLRHNAGNVAGVRVIVPANAVDTYDLAPGAAAGAAMAHPGEFFHRVFLYHLALNGVEVVAALR
jgi:nicotinamidase-related amidase